MTNQHGEACSTGLAFQVKRRLAIVTTSWDDGDPCDLRIAEALSSKRLPGTFYVPTRGYQRGPAPSETQLRALSAAGFEIGAHTVSHRNLSSLPPAELREEVWSCKNTLEEMLGQRITMFCYPNGRYNAGVIRQVEQAGYEGARTTRMLSTELRFQRFEMPTAVQAFPHPRRGYLKNLTRARNASGIIHYLAKWSWRNDWLELGKELFRQVLASGGVWHLYGHSWEIEALGIWPELREMLDYVSGRPEVTYITNGQLVELLKDGVQSPATTEA